MSEPVAEAMAAGALDRFHADTAVAVTGIADPGGGTTEKPFGTVCFTATLAEDPTVTRTIRLPGNRSDIRERSTTVALHILLHALSNPKTTSGVASRPPSCGILPGCPLMRRSRRRGW